MQPRSQNVRFRNKVVMVTGGASGIGEACIRMFAAEGASVVVADLLDEEAGALCRAIRDEGGVATFIHLDVSQEAQWSAAIDEIQEKLGRLDVLVNSAGISGFVHDRENTAYLDRIMAIHLRGCFLAIKHGAPAIARSGGGAIVTLSSIAAYEGFEGQHMGYNAAKAGVLAMTRCAAGEYARQGVRVNSVVPGLMTPMRTSVVSADPVMRARFFERVPINREGTAEEAAKAVLFLSSDEASYLTGADLVVDGGYTAYTY